MAADSVTFLREHGLRVFFDAEHFFDGYRDNPEFSLRGPAGRRGGRRRGPRAVRHQRRGPAPRRRAHRGRHRGRLRVPGRRALPQRLGLCRGQLHRRRPGRRHPRPGLRQRLRRAHRQRRSVRGHPQPLAEAQHPHHPAPTASNASRPCRTTSPSSSTWPPTPSSPTSARPPSPTRPVSTRAPSPAAATPTSTSPPDSVGNGTRFVVSEMAGRSTLALKAEELGLELDSDALAGVLDTLKTLEHRGYHFEVADGSLELLLRRATGWEPDFFELESFRVIADHTDTLGPIDGRHLDRGDGEGPGRRRPGGGHGRGQRTGQRPRLGPAPGHRRRTSRCWPASISSTTGSGSSTPAGAPGP